MTISTIPPLPAAVAVLALVPAAVALVASAAARTLPVGRAWRAARTATWVTAATAVVLAALRIGTDDRADRLVRVDTVTAVVLCLVALIGWVVVRYSARYLAGDPLEHRAASRLTATLAAVSLVVVANDLVLLALAWTATSLSLHGLLTFFRDRPAAVAAAHKKFLLARTADVCMLGAVVAFAGAFHTTRIDAIVGEAARAGSLGPGARVGILLVAVAAVLKCAQLPFHGWLIQVMEAPTPVSALLHAGVVNLGGFVLLRLAPVVDRAVEARALLVLVGMSTVVVASMVMTTRVSVKVALAWSTCAQMGFMLVQCGLGLWEMALLHLVAHSVYKAHAFLGAGGTVVQAQRDQLIAHPPAPSTRSVVRGVAVAAAATGLVAAAWVRLPFATPLTSTAWVFVATVAIAIVPLAVPALGRRSSLVARALAVPAVYLALHEVAGRLVPHGDAPPLALVVFVAAAMTSLFVVHTLVTVSPSARVSTRLRPWLYRGLFLDDAFTRVAFALWPPPATEARPSLLPAPVGAMH